MRNDGFTAHSRELSSTLDGSIFIWQQTLSSSSLCMSLVMNISPLFTSSPGFSYVYPNPMKSFLANSLRLLFSRVTVAMFMVLPRSSPVRLPFTLSSFISTFFMLFSL